MDNFRQKYVRILFVITAVWFMNSCASNGSTSSQKSPGTDSVSGIWKGESICFGDRPACRNEIVVYRFEPVTGSPGEVWLKADKIVEGKREPMGKLKFRYDDVKGELSSEFKVRETHGLWEFKQTGDTIEGTLVILPDRKTGRRVKVKRVSEKDVPAAPADDEYEEI